jgi:hypothetical protein
VIFESVRAPAAHCDLTVGSVGVKDVILPGDMRDILNQEVQAEMAAQADIVKRREETAATRSPLNTAKLMEENPVLLRLMELETLEKITEKVDKLTGFTSHGGDRVRLGKFPATEAELITRNTFSKAFHVQCVPVSTGAPDERASSRRIRCVGLWSVLPIERSPGNKSRAQEST